jgi:hypothetical protein
MSRFYLWVPVRRNSDGMVAYRDVIHGYGYNASTYPRHDLSFLPPGLVRRSMHRVALAVVPMGNLL